MSNNTRPGKLGSAYDLEVEERLLECTKQPQPDGQKHLRAPRRGDVSKVDDIRPAEASEQLGNPFLGLRVVAAHEHGVVTSAKLSRVVHEVGVHGVQGLDHLRLDKPPLDLLS